MLVTVAVMSQGRLNACHRQDFPYMNYVCERSAHTPFSRPSPNIGAKEQSALSMARIEPKTLGTPGRKSGKGPVVPAGKRH